MSKALFDFLNGFSDEKQARFCVSLIAEECSIIRDFGTIEPFQSVSTGSYNYEPSMNSVAEVRIDGQVYFEKHAFGRLRFLVKRELKEHIGEAPHGTFDNQLEQIMWWESSAHLNDWVQTLQMFEPSKQNLTLLICLHKGDHYWETEHIKTQVGSSSFAESVLSQVQN